jgi:hypothetical protein
MTCKVVDSESGEVTYGEQSSKAEAHKLQDALRAKGHHAVVVILPEGSYEVSVITGKLTCAKSWNLKFKIETIAEIPRRNWAQTVLYAYEQSQLQGQAGY